MRAPARALLRIVMMIDSTHDFATHVAAHSGLSVDRCERASTVVLGRLGAYLGAPQRQLVADELPPALALAFLDPGNVAVPLEELVLGDDLEPGHARELIACVCRVLAEGLSTDALALLRHAASSDIRTLLVPPSPELVRDSIAPWRRDTLAMGRPGSQHPIAETPPDRTQAGSVSDDNPHAATKLSTTPGTTQERRHESLSDADPNPKHPLSGSRR
jgi:uncharacterized protein (DUF2267 family)